jgi:hypothetical protein
MNLPENWDQLLKFIKRRKQTIVNSIHSIPSLLPELLIHRSEILKMKTHCFGKQKLNMTLTASSFQKECRPFINLLIPLISALKAMHKQENPKRNISILEINQEDIEIPSDSIQKAPIKIDLYHSKPDPRCLPLKPNSSSLHSSKVHSKQTKVLRTPAVLIPTTRPSLVNQTEKRIEVRKSREFKSIVDLPCKQKEIQSLKIINTPFPSSKVDLPHPITPKTAE